MQFTGKGKRKIENPPKRFRQTRVCSRRLARLVLILCVFCVTEPGSRAQLPEPPLPVDPRPLSQLISQVEKNLLADSRNPKKLVEAYLKISDTHLQMALDLIKANNHGASERELDVYNKAVAAAGKEAFALQDGKRTISKKIEQTLYRQIKTLETIERLFPIEREVFADAALKHAKALRVQALNEAFASGEVLKDPDEEKKPKSEPPPKESPNNPPAPPPQAPDIGSVGAYMSFRVGADSGLLTARSSRLRFASLPVRAWYPKSASWSLQVTGDYMTEEEDDHVREAQAADMRAKVFMKIADRRLKAVAGPTAPATDKKDQKKADEEEREWGALPKVSRAELLRHYARAIAECMAKLEDAYERNPKSSALPKALAILRASTDKQLETLRTLKAEMKTESEIAAIAGAIGEAETANKGARDGLK
jgi:hypothetical protein